MSYVNKRLAKRMGDPAFAKAWKESELEYNISRNIIKKRIERGWSQKDLANRMSTTQSIVSRIESGDANITVKTLATVANALGTEVSELVEITEEQEPIMA